MRFPFLPAVFSIAIGSCLLLVTPVCNAHPAAAATTETIVMIRHGEKPAAGLGQLDCQGLNRSLALPNVLIRKFGRPDYIFAPNPAFEKPDHGKLYSYIRPLATIEPTAVRLGLPINTQFGSLEIQPLEHTLLSPTYYNATIFIAWEHAELVKLARQLVKDTGGKATEVPDWDRKDFDGIYVLQIVRQNGQETVHFKREAEGLQHLSSSCPDIH